MKLNDLVVGAEMYSSISSPLRVNFQIQAKVSIMVRLLQTLCKCMTYIVLVAAVYSSNFSPLRVNF